MTSAGAIGGNVFGGNFIGAPASPPADILPRYDVAFHVELPQQQGVQVLYIVRYMRDPRSGEGFIYLPTRDEPNASLNASTIMRDGLDGHWHYAPRAWSDAVNRAIARN